MTPFSDSRPVELSPGDNFTPKPPPKSSNAGLGCAFAFLGVFFLIGATMFVTMFALPVAKVVKARTWIPVPCRIVSSVVTSHSGSDGPTYSADIIYAYVVGPVTYNSSKYSFGLRNQSSFKSKQAIVSAYPTGSASTCYVNPNNPREAVLQRGLTGDVWSGLFSLPFLLFGLGGMWAIKRSTANVLSPKAQWKPSHAPTADSGPLVLQATSSPWGRFVGLGCVSAFWNGIVGFMAYQFISNGGFFAAFGALFFIPFILIGLVMLWAWVQCGLALGNARPVLTLSRGALRVGESADLQFELRDGYFMPQYLEIILEGREEATFTRGTDTVTDKSIFYLQTLTQISGRSGSTTVTIPAGTMHSFEAPRNKILWVLRANGPIPRWPDISEEWKITVEPGR